MQNLLLQIVILDFQNLDQDKHKQEEKKEELSNNILIYLSQKGALLN